jgi:hypothetical protein
MISEKNAPRLLGAMFLIVIVTSALGGMQSSVTGTGTISDVLVAISYKPTQMQWTALGNLVNSLGIIALAVLLFTVLKRQNKILALVALGWRMGEALFCAIKASPGRATPSSWSSTARAASSGIYCSSNRSMSRARYRSSA